MSASARSSAAAWPVVGSDGPGEVTDCLGGAAHLAYAQAPVSGLAVITAGFSAYEARTRAQARAAALDYLHGFPHGGPEHSTTGGRELRLADFVQDPPEGGGLRVPGTGLLSGNPYHVPVEVVWLGERECRIEPTMSGVVDNGVSGGISGILAHEVVSRWWASPRHALLRVSAHLDRLLPQGVMAAATGLGLRVSGFVLSARDVRVALVIVGGDGATMAAAAGRTVKSAVSEAFLQAMAAKAEPWDTLTTADSLRRFAVWHREADYAAYLERSAVDADPRLIEEPGGLRPASWPEIAGRWFGNEPVAIEAGASGEIVKVVCPGAACYRATPAGTALPCPVP
ncbi:hypothetical protein HS041_14970 [Planomonospora sp. ID67723]|uniref:hypothetical protein n=1 Tax=Planomonospora sp. ID67723 TaxID=2738134 RepID=UPI0018C39F72|nr:hypothetical protein [Planomonospora sp. ID67723]MBG0829072.1 hypothetical protein [Planomonospora sp. ID67723]